MRLATLLIASLSRRFRTLGRHLGGEGLVGLSAEGMAHALTHTINEKVTRPFILGLDDVQCLNSSRSALTLLDEFVRNQPDQVTLLVAGRAVPEIPMTHLVAEGEVAAIGPADLALTREELIAVEHSRMGVDLDAKTADRMLDETGGWVMGVLLSGNASVRGMQILAESTQPAVYDYLASVVLGKQPEKLRRFMLEACALPVMTAEACNAVLGMGNSRRYLQQLVRRGLFVVVVEEHPRTYEFHSQFRRFLIETLRSTGGNRLRTLQARSASYLAKHGEPEEAVGLYVDAGDLRRAGRLAGRNAARLEREGRYGLLEVWREDLRRGGVFDPHVDLSLACALVMQGRGPEARALIRRWRRAAGSSNAELRRKYHLALVHQLVFASRFEKAIKTIRRFTWRARARGDREGRADCLLLEAFCDIERRADLTRAADLALDAVRIGERLGNATFLANALSNASAAVWAAFGPLEAIPLAKRGYRLAAVGPSPTGRALLLNNLGSLEHSVGRYEAGFQHLNEGLVQARRADARTWESQLSLSLADLLADLRLVDQASSYYRSAASVGERAWGARQRVVSSIQEANCYRRNGDPERARRVMASIRPGSGRQWKPPLQLAKAALEVSEHPSGARRIVRRLFTAGQPSLYAEEEVFAHYLLSRAAWGLSEGAFAKKYMGEALSRAKQIGAEQVIARELQKDEAFRSFAEAQFAESDLFAVVLNRIADMKAFAKKLGANGMAPSHAARIQVSAMGGNEVALNDRALRALPPLARQLAAYLADTGQVQRDRLMEDFWPASSKGCQTANFHSTLYSLRRALGKNAILQEAGTYLFNPKASIQFDVAMFEQAAVQAQSSSTLPEDRPAELDGALEMYKGEFLPGCCQEWAARRREILAEKYLALSRAFAEAALQAGRSREAAERLRSALAVDPYDDDLNLLYLEALGNLGRRGPLVAHYHRYCKLLATELGLDPPAQVRSRYTDLIG
jgi:ATP/maltotriose-dependent transcriptional regulator MalT/DNA-binding SARP family transcriptional activator